MSHYNFLDIITMVMVVIVTGFITVVAQTPFAIGLLLSAVILVTYGGMTKQDDLVAIAAFFPTFGMIAWALNYLVFRMTPHTIDSRLLQVDRGVGVLFWHNALAHPYLWDFLSLVYGGIGIATAVALCCMNERKEFLYVYVLAAVLAPICYLLFPAVGPSWIAYGAGSYIPRNCLPSLHFTWALLLFLYASRWRAAFAVFMILTGWATMGLGEHYAIDLVAALPFTVIVVACVRLAMQGRSLYAES